MNAFIIKNERSKVKLPSLETRGKKDNINPTQAENNNIRAELNENGNKKIKEKNQRSQRPAFLWKVSIQLINLQTGQARKKDRKYKLLTEMKGRRRASPQIPQTLTD